MMGCKSIIKYIAFTLNVALVLGGITLLGIGMHVTLNMAIHSPIIGSSYHNVSIGALVLGACTLIAALIGIFGAYKEKFYIIISNVAFLSFITLALFGIVAMLVVQKVIYNLDTILKL